MVLLGIIVWRIALHLTRLIQGQPGGWQGTCLRITDTCRPGLQTLRRFAPALATSIALVIVVYAAALRGDALVARYGPLERPAWARAVQDMSAPFADLRPRSFAWSPVEGYGRGDPVNYIRYATEMESFYAAHVREPLFPFCTKVFLWLLNQQDVAVSFASGLFSILCVWATWLLGSYAFSRWVGLGAALGVAVEPELISWGVNGWRDDAFMFFVVLSSYALLRCHRQLTYRHAVWAGIVAGLACLTRLTSLSFLVPGFVILAWSYRVQRERLALLGLAMFVATLLAAPFLINCWREFGDPLYAINAHTKFYQTREGTAPQPDLSATTYIGTMFRDDPVRTVETMVVGLTTYPFTNKWRGFNHWLPRAGRWLSWSALVGLALFLTSSRGRLLLIVLGMSLLPYAFTWPIRGGAEWRFTQHAYPFFLIAACWTPVWATQIVFTALAGWRGGGGFWGSHPTAGPARPRRGR